MSIVTGGTAPPCRPSVTPLLRVAALDGLRLWPARRRPLAGVLHGSGLDQPAHPPHCDHGSVLTRCSACKSSWSAVLVATNFIVERCTHQDCVLERDDYDQSPQDQRGNAQYSAGGECPTGSGSLLESVKRARADVAVDDAERGQSRCAGSCRVSAWGSAAACRALAIPRPPDERPNHFP
jgi:hypothetical protein